MLFSQQEGSDAEDDDRQGADADGVQQMPDVIMTCVSQGDAVGVAVYNRLLNEVSTHSLQFCKGMHACML